MIIMLAWPDKALWVNRNRGKSWHTLSKAKEAALSEGCAATLQALGGQRKPDWQGARLQVEIVAHKGNKAPFDLDNLAGAMKAHLDGISATLGINDNQIDRLIITREYTVKGGMVNIIIQELIK